MAVPVEPAACLDIVGEGLVRVTYQVLVDTRVSVSGEVAVVVALAHGEIFNEVIVGHAVAVQDRHMVRKVDTLHDATQVVATLTVFFVRVIVIGSPDRAAGRVIEIGQLNVVQQLTNISSKKAVSSIMHHLETGSQWTEYAYVFFLNVCGWECLSVDLCYNRLWISSVSRETSKTFMFVVCYL